MKTRGRKVDANRAFRFAHFIVCGMAIGLYVAKATDIFGVDVTPAIETSGVAVGGAVVALLKLAHLA